MVTIKDVAQEAGVSIATVSYVLNNSAKIKEETKSKVLAAVEKLGYKPNSLAKGLKTRKSRSIGIITEDITVFNTPLIIDGINEFAEAKGYHIVLDNLRLNKLIHNDYDRAAEHIGVVTDAFSTLLSKQVDGIIYVGAHIRDVSALIQCDIDVPLVFAYCSTSREDGVSICYNDKDGAYDATRHLIDMGHRRIAVIGGLGDSIQTKKRMEGFRDALREADIAFPEEYLEYGDWEYASGKEIAARLLSLPEPPSAIFAMNDLMAIGAIGAAEEMSLSVPDDVSVVGFDNREFSKYHSPRLTTVSLPLTEIGKTCTDILIGMIDDKAPEKYTQFLHCTLKERSSVKKLG
ncbi:MAG: LacI family DNA-binding transcriptional regulator [Clostridia bacterium]|nr:LacI family DNA-binding transcriptional regulator [Clostridia bacterium]MBQ9994398.1 LacI family DNA-binding transcriptional regulator [Clostridia bacterium]